jgi:hypothetical protein
MWVGKLPLHDLIGRFPISQLWLESNDFGTSIVVPHLTQPIFDYLAWLQCHNNKKRGVISRSDIALEWPCPAQAVADDLKAFLKRHARIVYRRQGDMQYWDNHGGWAWLKYKSGDRRSKNLLVYANKHSETIERLIGSRYRCHFELRFLTSRACTSAGLEYLKDLPQLDPHDLFARCVRLNWHTDARGPIQVFYDRYPHQRRTLIDIPIKTLRIPHCVSLIKVTNLTTFTTTTTQQTPILSPQHHFPSIHESHRLNKQ